MIFDGLQLTLAVLGMVQLLLAVVIVLHYASPRTPLLIKVIATISFALSFAGTALLPIDLNIASSLSSEEDGNVNVNNTLLPWKITFWSTFVLAWLVLPVVREILQSGEFTTMSRIRHGIKEALQTQCILLCVVVVLIVGLAIKLKSLNVLPVLITFGNTYGLLIVSLLLGYGLVALPRSLWRQSYPERELRRAQIMLSSVDEALFEAVWELQDCEYVIDATALDIRDIDSNNNENVYYQNCIDDLLKRKNETASMSPELHRRRTNTERKQEEDNGKPSLDMLRQLNCRLKYAHENLKSTELRWESLVGRCRFYSSLVNNLQPKSFSTGIQVPFVSLDGTEIKFRTFRNRAKFFWQTRLRSSIFRLLAVFTAVLSFMILWSEATLSLSVNLSPFALFLNFFEAKQGESSAVLFIISALIPLLYMSICVYSSLFKVSVFGPFALHGQGQSHPVALVFNAQYLVRLQFSLGYNYLLMLKYDTDSTACAFSEVMGAMSVFPFFGTSFSVYAPLFIIALCGFTLCNGYPRLLALLSVEHEDAILSSGEETLTRKLREGIKLLKKYEEKEQKSDIDNSSKAITAEKELGTDQQWRNTVV